MRENKWTNALGKGSMRITVTASNSGQQLQTLPETAVKCSSTHGERADTRGMPWELATQVLFYAGAAICSFYSITSD